VAVRLQQAGNVQGGAWPKGRVRRAYQDQDPKVLEILMTQVVK
jgi:hypothetical protein